MGHPGALDHCLGTKLAWAGTTHSPLIARWQKAVCWCAGGRVNSLRGVSPRERADPQLVRGVQPEPCRPGFSPGRVLCLGHRVHGCGDRYYSSDGSSGVYTTLAESWNGTSWSVVNSPSPSDNLNQLNSVSCVSPVACTAVGYVSTLSGGYRTLIESWNGTSWSVVSSPNIGSATSPNSLEGVSCTSATACTAVGVHYASSRQSWPDSC
jgi:hypothetical protein